MGGFPSVNEPCSCSLLRVLREMDLYPVAVEWTRIFPSACIS